MDESHFFLITAAKYGYRVGDGQKAFHRGMSHCVAADNSNTSFLHKMFLSKLKLLLLQSESKTVDMEVIKGRIQDM